MVFVQIEMMVEAAAIGEVEPGQNDQPEQDVDVTEDDDGEHDEPRNKKNVGYVARMKSAVFVWPSSLPNSAAQTRLAITVARVEGE